MEEDKIMKIGIIGDKDFSDYEAFKETFESFLLNLDILEDEVNVYSAGPANIEAMAEQSLESIKNNLRENNKKTKIIPVSVDFIRENVDTMAVLSFSTTPEIPLF